MYSEVIIHFSVFCHVVRNVILFIILGQKRNGPPSPSGWGCGFRPGGLCPPAPHWGYPLEQWFSQCVSCPEHSPAPDWLCLQRRTLWSRWRLQEQETNTNEIRSPAEPSSWKHMRAMTVTPVAAEVYLCLWCSGWLLFPVCRTEGRTPENRCSTPAQQWSTKTI